MAESFARLLKRRRLEAGLSQEKLAELSRVSTDEISALERGLRRAPHKATLDLLIAALTLDDRARLQIEEAAKLARPRGPQPLRDDFRSDLRDEVLTNNLPPQLTSFVDREKEAAEIKELLQSHRFVTVVGTGGAGKTRCAIQVARELLDFFRDGVWLAELAPISDPVLVCNVIARALGVQEAPDRPILDTLLAYLKRKYLLLILDNCEHLIGEARRVTAEVLRSCADIRILATSRESFTIAGERVYRMPSLPVPSMLEFLSVEQMSRYGAVQLFSDRAVSSDNRFILTVQSAPHVAEICQRLDGIPLAIELAAARVKTLSPKQLAQKLDERFRVLTGGDRSALPRHQTMRALIDWSYDLLTDEERTIFRRLSIFAGGFTLETAAAVCSKGEMDEIVVLDLLSSLVDKSLVLAEVSGVDGRYRLLESTRQYAHEKLCDTGEDETIAQAHARTFLGLAEQLCDAWGNTPDRAWNAQVEPKLENFRAALSWAFGSHGDVLLGQRLAGALRRVWFFYGLAEGLRWVQAAQQRVTLDTPDAVVAELDTAESGFTSILNQYKASLSFAERALTRYRKLGDTRGISAAEGQIARAQAFLGKTAEAERLCRQALHAPRTRRSIIYALDTLAFARQFAGDLATARQHFREALSAAWAFGAERSAAHISLNLAEAEFHDGNAVEALRLADEALPILRALGDTRHVAGAHYNMAAYLVALRRYDEARTAAREAVTAARDAQFPVGLAFTLQHLAATAALRPNADAQVVQDHRRAARMLGYVDACLSALEALRQYTEQQEYDAIIPALRDALGEDDLSKLMTEGATWIEDQAVSEAMLI